MYEILTKINGDLFHIHFDYELEDTYFGGSRGTVYIKNVLDKSGNQVDMSNNFYDVCHSKASEIFQAYLDAEGEDDE